MECVEEVMDFRYLQTKPGVSMPATVAEMTQKELAQMLSMVVEQKLVELFGDPDEGLHMKEALRKRLIRQKKSVSKGERGTDFSDVSKRLGL